jgi:hypothetical protein
VGISLRCQIPPYPTSYCNTRGSSRLPTTSPTRAFTVGYIFEPIRSQASAWERPLARPYTSTTYVACTMTTEGSVRSDSPFVCCGLLHLATEPARIALCHTQRNAVGRRSRPKAETLSAARKARDRALRIPCFSPWKRDRDGRRMCSDGDSTESPRSLRCAHNDEIHTGGLRDGRKIAARFGELLTSSPTVTMAAGNA